MKKKTEWFLIFSETILTFKSKMAAQKWPLTPYLNNKQRYLSAAWAIKTYKVSFFTNSGFTDLIDMILIVFWVCLDFQFKMADQNGYKRHIQNQKKWHLLM